MAQDVVTATGREYARHAHPDKHGSKEVDADFIAHARNDVPFLLALVESQAKMLERAHDVVAFVRRMGHHEKSGTELGQIVALFLTELDRTDRGE